MLLGLIDVRERRQPGLKSLTNLVKVVSKEWATWLGFKTRNATDNNKFSSKSGTDQRAISERATAKGLARSCRLQ